MRVTTVLLFFFFTAPSTADIITRKLRSDNRTTILFTEFGFSDTGHVSSEISSMSVTSNSPQPDPSRIGFFLLSHDMRHDYFHEQNPDMCVLDNKFISLLFTFEDLNLPLQSPFNKSYPVTHPGVYSLYFANCNNQSLVTMDVRTELYNIDGTTKNYLSTGLTQLPSLYLIFSIVHLCFLVIWIFVCFKNHRSVHTTIHILMGVLLVTTSIHLMCAAADQHYLKVTGVHGYAVLFYIFRFIRTAVLFTVMVLLGGGWSLGEPFFQRREKVVLLIAILVEVLAYGYLILVGDTVPYNQQWLSWNTGFLLLDYVSCFVISLHVLWSVNLSCESCEGKWNPNKKLSELSTLDVFTFLVSAYLLFMRVIVSMVLAYGVMECPWVINAVEETSSLVFYMVMFYMYRPSVFDDEENSAGMGLLDEEYGLRTSKSSILSSFCCS